MTCVEIKVKLRIGRVPPKPRARDARLLSHLPLSYPPAHRSMKEISIMFKIWGSKPAAFCDGIARRDFLRLGGLGLGGLMLSDLLRLRAQEQAPRSKSVIMVLLIGGPSHIDMYDLKPDAPQDIRGEFKPIATKTPGMQICELMPLQAQIADKLAIIRNLKFSGDDHSGEELTTGFRAEGRLVRQLKRPAHGAIVSFLKGRPSKVPAYVVLSP